MRAIQNLSPPLAVWVLGAGFVWLVLNYEAQHPRTESELGVTLVSDANVTMEKQSAFGVLSATDYNQRLQFLAERPLFSETRRIPVHEPIEELPIDEEVDEFSNEVETIAELPPLEAPNLDFKGFMRTGEQIKALIVMRETSEERWVSVGDKIMEWSIIEVSELIVKVERSGFEHIVEISE